MSRPVDADTMIWSCTLEEMRAFYETQSTPVLRQALARMQRGLRKRWPDWSEAPENFRTAIPVIEEVLSSRTT